MRERVVGPQPHGVAVADLRVVLAALAEEDVTEIQLGVGGRGR